MGKPIVYCDTCGERLRDEDFAKGKAFTLENRNYCLAHRPSGAVPASLPPGSSARIPVSGITPRRAMSAAPAKPPPRSPWPWVAVGAGVGLAILLAVLTSSGAPPAPPEPAPPPRPVARPTAPPPPPPAPAPREDAGDGIRKQAQLDRFIADVRGQIREAKDLEAKRAEIEGRIRAAEAAGGARPEFAELRAELAAALERAKELPGLVGRWALDEVNAERTPDAGPNGLAGLVKGKVVPAPGRIGGGLELDGSGGHVELPKVDSLRNLQRGSYTLAAWYRPSEAPSATTSKDNNWAQGLVVKAGNHTGILLVTGNRFVIDHWLEAGGHAHATGNSTCGAGRFYHVAGVVDAAAGEVRVFVDGKRDASKAFAKGAVGRDYASGPWRIGIALPNGKEYRYAAKGLIDDVRIYDRALTDEEVKTLFSAAK